MNSIPKTRKPQIVLLQSTESGALIGSNDDLLTEILIRLPVASILLFKSVSKHWHWLLTHRHFTRRYDNLSKSPGIFVREQYFPFNVEDPSIPPFRSLKSYFDCSGLGPVESIVKIVQSCNGLLLCYNGLGPNRGKANLKYYVFNPTTKQLAVIPSVPGGLKVRKTILFMGLAFHQTDCAHYKVVCIRYLEPRGELHQVLMYSSDTRKWKISIESFSVPKPVLFRKGVYWNRAVFWAPFYRNHLYFRIDTEQLQTLPLPEGLMSSEIMTMYLGESRGHLHLIAHKNHQDNRPHLNVYEMFSDHSGWFVKYKLPRDQLGVAFPEIISHSGYGYGYGFTVMDVIRGEEEEDTFMVLKTYERITTYNVHGKSFKEVLLFFCSYYERVIAFHRYTETLTSF